MNKTNYRKTKEVKNKMLKARVTESEQQLIQNYAKLNGMNVSDYIMSLIWADMEKE
ncbi:MAG: DUF6290 family protein [Paraclostridium sp.]